MILHNFFYFLAKVTLTNTICRALMDVLYLKTGFQNDQLMLDCPPHKVEKYVLASFIEELKKIPRSEWQECRFLFPDDNVGVTYRIIEGNIGRLGSKFNRLVSRKMLLIRVGHCWFWVDPSYGGMTFRARAYFYIDSRKPEWFIPRRVIEKGRIR